MKQSLGALLRQLVMIAIAALIPVAFVTFLTIPFLLAH